MSIDTGRPRAPRTEIRALDAWIEAIMALQGVEGDGAVAGSLLILAPRLQSIPAEIIHEGTLSPVDRLAWMVIFQAAIDGGGTASFPSYRALTGSANLGSSATVSRALATLRILRWMTVSRRKAPGEGVGGLTVHTLHGYALTVEDALLLDPGYLDYLEGARTHHHARVRALAEAEWSRYQNQAKAQTQTQTHTKPRKNAAVELPADRLQTSIAGVRESAHPDSGSSESEALQNSKYCSSSSKQLPKQQKTVKQKKHNNHRNLAPNPAAEYVARETSSGKELVFPEQFAPEQRQAAQRYLANVPGDIRQAVIDELTGRLAVARSGGTPVRDPLGYLRGLCDRARRGKFVANLGIAVRDRRGSAPMTTTREEAAAEPEEREKPQKPQKPSDRPERVDREAALQVLAEIRQSLGQSFRSSTATPPSSDRNRTDR
jgi:hypothetical protein